MPVERGHVGHVAGPGRADGHETRFGFPGAARRGAQVERLGVEQLDALVGDDGREDPGVGVLGSIGCGKASGNSSAPRFTTGPSLATSAGRETCGPSRRRPSASYDAQ